jgi:hypothetical protein
MRARPRIIPAALATVLALALAACSSGGASESSDTSAKKTTTTKPAATVLLTQGESAVASAGPDVALDDATRQAVLDASQRYVDAAVLEPLTKGAVDTAYPGLFDASVSASATGPDRAALTDEGITTVTTSPTVTASPVRFDGLADANGAVQFVATTFTLDVKGATAAGPLAVQRSADLTFAPGAGGTWLITAYRVAVVRQEPDGSTTTTTAAHS